MNVIHAFPRRRGEGCGNSFNLGVRHHRGHQHHQRPDFLLPLDQRSDMAADPTWLPIRHGCRSRALTNLLCRQEVSQCLKRRRFGFLPHGEA